MSFMNNSTEYGILSDSEINSIISNFSDKMIYDIVEASYNSRFRPYQLYTGNLIAAIENNYKASLMAAPQHADEIMQSRNELLSIILEKLCSFNDINISMSYENDTIDLYSLVYFLYDFFISRFTINLVNFFANFIIKEQESLVEMINIAEAKKSNNKDTGSNYSRKMFKGNNNLALIHANLEKIVDNICGLDVSMEDLIFVSTGDLNISGLICKYTREIVGVFKTQFIPCIKNPISRPVVLTMIRLRLQELSSENISVAVV